MQEKERFWLGNKLNHNTQTGGKDHEGTSGSTGNQFKCYRQSKILPVPKLWKVWKLRCYNWISRALWFRISHFEFKKSTCKKTTKSHWKSPSSTNGCHSWMKPESTSYDWKMLMLYQWPAAEKNCIYWIYYGNRQCHCVVKSTFYSQSRISHTR